VGEGFELQLPRDWVRKYGPAMATGLFMMKMVASIGSLAATSVRELIRNASRYD